MAKAGAREKIQLRSTGKNKAGKPTGYFKTSMSNKHNTEKLERNKFDPRAYNPETGKCGMVVKFIQKKIAK
ncbi:MAG: ribosomal protein L33 [uncultured bacterium]|nr:MAG: ribosomal protein L33 [uncultured bacterium]OGT46918.1 MAG: 50S ribosomal protein L33 [Gammaproteobacteria bacterium RIFCSPHIGHO2_12_FULL_38_11]